MKKFPYKFTPTVIVLLCVGIAAACACVALNVIRFVANLQSGTAIPYNYITVFIAVLVGVAFIVLAISIFADSGYSIDDKYLTLRWGFIVNRYELSRIREIKHFAKTDKLVVYYDADKFFVIFVRGEVYDPFTDALLAANKKILYVENSEDEDAKLK